MLTNIGRNYIRYIKMKLYTFSKHIKFRKEADCLLIYDCKLLRDFKVDLAFENFIHAVYKGIKENTTGCVKLTNAGKHELNQ